MGVIYKNGIAYSGDTPEMAGATSSAAGKSGLVPAPSAGDQKKFLKADGTWATPDGKYLVQSGVVTSFTSGKMVVTFPTAYKKLLGVSVIPWLATSYFCTLNSSDTEGFSIYVWKSASTSPVQSSATVAWFAIGEV